MSVFEEYESAVRSYGRIFPTLIQRAKGAMLYSPSGAAYIDFFAGAGTMNYGHNNDYIKQHVLDYLESDGIIHALDMQTSAKQTFLETFAERILQPRGLDYKVQFCGPTGTNAVEAAFKLARKLTKRTTIGAFMGGYHGLSLGSLAATGKANLRAAAGVPLSHVTFLPYPYGFMASFDTIAYLETVLNDPYSGVDKPAAIIFETVQAEGGVVVAPVEWMVRLRELCSRHGILLICDEIQTGCGRTGPFFSFERAGIVPDIVTLSKAISGYGFPMSLLLMRPELDIWTPGEHTGTFRGNQLAFVAATAALEYRDEHHLEQQVREKEAFLADFLNREIAALDQRIAIRGLGLLWGIDLTALGDQQLAPRIRERCFKEGLLVEDVGRNDGVLKLLPPLTIEPALLAKGCAIIKRATQEILEAA